MRRFASIAGALGALTCFAACGSSSDGGSPTASPARGGEAATSAAAGDPGNANEVAAPSASRPADVNPCKLVSRAQAQAIIGTRVSKPELGRQGPTCVYRVARVEQPITLAVQRGSVAYAAQTGRNVIRAEVAGRKAVCVDDGGIKVLVPLTAGSVLAVGAPCPIATELAATALRRLR